MNDSGPDRAASEPRAGVPNVAVIGDFSPANRTHALTNASLEHLGLPIEWIATEDVGAPEVTLAAYDGLLISPGSPYVSMDGALEAIRYARERGVPLVGT
jgi:CTP synthase (UTP-ammonia lyase)